MTDKVPISVVIPTYKRVQKLAITLDKIFSCSPLPTEIIIHIDGGDSDSESFLTENFPLVKIVKSKTSVGPGGGRSKAIAIANNEYIASFDDDSYPVQSDYFDRLYKIFNAIPSAALIESTIYHLNEEKPLETREFWHCHLFTACGVAYRKNWFNKIGDFVPVTIAYGLEEVDFALRATQWQALFIRTSWLTVFHNTELSHHVTSKINAAAISNIGVLAFLRYPVKMWLYASFQVLNRIVWSFRNKRFNGLVKGVLQIPIKSYSLVKYRKALPSKTIVSFLKNRAIVKKYEFPV